MSFDIYVVAFQNGVPAAFPVDLIAEAFSEHLPRQALLDEPAGPWWARYPSRPITSPDDHEAPGDERGPPAGAETLWAEITPTGASEDGVTGFTVNRPPLDEAFLACVLSVLRRTNSALYWPGENALVVGREDTLAHLPETMVESLGAPFLATTAAEIAERIQGS